MVVALDLNATSIEDAKAHLTQLAADMSEQNTDETLLEFARVLCEVR